MVLGARYGNVQEGASLPPFVDPSSVPGCCLWLDGSDPAGTGTPPSGGTSVSTWVDKSGKGNNGTASGTARGVYETNILNSKGVMKFDSTVPQIYTITSPSSFPLGDSGRTFFVVFNTDATGLTEQTFLQTGDISTGNDNYSIELSLSNFRSRSTFGFTNTCITTSISNNTWYRATAEAATGQTNNLFTYTINSVNQSFITSDSVTINTTATDAYVADDFSGGSPGVGAFDQYIAEMIFYNNEISSTSFTNVQNYLIAKWGI